MHNEHKTVENLISRLKKQGNYLIRYPMQELRNSDPGFYSSRCIENGITRGMVPEAQLLSLPALVNSGLQ
jgi:16S rRNA (cytidine1402-2'-O)-methyltransferase